MTEICKTANKALRAYYYLERPRSHEEDDILRQIRSEIRRHLPYIAAASKETASDLMRGGTDIYPLEYPADFAVLYGQFAPLWSDDPKSSAQALLEAYKYVGEFEPPLCDKLRDIITAQREEHMPLTVAWEVRDRSSVISEREALLETIARNGPEGRVHAAALNLSRFLHTFIFQLIRSIPVDRVVAAVHRLQDTVWDSREEIITGGVPAHTLAAVILYMSEGAEYDSYADALMLDNIAFRKKLLMFLMERQWAGPQEVYGALLSDVRFTPEERDKLTDALSEMAKQKGAPRYTSFYPEQIAAATTGAQPPKPPANTPESPKKLPPSVTYEILSDTNYQYADRCIVRGDSFFVRVSGRFLRKIVEITPSTGVKNAYDIPEEADSYGSDAWDISGENIYFGQKEKLIQASLKTTQSTSIPVAYFETNPGIIRVIDGKVYASLLRGGIVRTDPVTGQSELLASARRRPGQTILDDGPDFEVQRITSLPNGPAFTIVQAHAYHVTVWNDSNHNFEELTNSLPNGLGYNPEFMLKWLGSEGSILSAATHLEACFLVDPQRTGKFPRLTTWPPPMKINGDESFPSELITAASTGDTVYILFRGGVDRTLHLKVMDKNRNISIPLEVPFGQRSPLNQVSALESGILLTGQGSKDALFFSRKDLDAFQP